jgi:hypothetical protein
MRPSAEPGPIITAAIYAQALPILGYALTRRRSRIAAFVTLGGMITVLANVIGRPLAQATGNNFIVGYISIPFTAGAYLLALAELQVSYLERVMFRIGLGLFIGIYLLLVSFFEDVTHFGQFSHTLYSFVLLVAALWTLGRRAFTQEDALALDTDWFWIGFGLAIYGAATAASAAIGNILLARDRVDLFVKAWDVRAALVILAFLAITWGVFRGPARESEFAPHQ